MTNQPPILGPRQRKFAGFTITLACLAFLAGLIVFTIQIFSLLVSTFSSLLWPLAVAGILALMLRPLVLQFQIRLKISPVFSVILLYGIVAVASVGILAWILPILIEQIRDFAIMLPDLLHKALLYLQENLPNWAETFRGKSEQHAFIQENLESALNHLSDWLLNAFPGIIAAGGAVLGIFGIAIGLSIVPVYLFFFLQSQRDPTDGLHEMLPFLKPETRNDVVFLIREFISIIVAFFRGQLLIALLVGVLLASGFTAVGLRFSILLGIVLGLLNIIPYLGVILGFVITIPLALLQPGGSITLAAMVAGVFIIVQVLESTVLTPKIMGDRTGLHPAAIIIAIFFWGIALDGLLGMIFAIPFTAFLVTAWRFAKTKYIREIL